jgi:[calcium/calmodulin-dependent protein kinase] kinase
MNRRLLKINYANCLDNQKQHNSKSNKKDIDLIKISNTYQKLNDFSKSNNQNFYNNKFIINQNSIFNSNIHNNHNNHSNNNKASNSINNYMNIYYKNNGINKGNSNYYLNKMMKTNHTINHNNKSEIYNKKIYINASSRKNNTNMLNIMNKKKNNDSFNFNNINNINNKLVNNSNISIKKVIPMIKNNKKSIDKNNLKKNKLINSITPNANVNEINKKIYNNKTFSLNIINSNATNLFYVNNLNMNNNFSDNIHMKTLNSKTLTENSNDYNRTKTININLDMQKRNNIFNDDSDINYGKIGKNSNIFETDDVTVSYDKKNGNKIVNEFYFLDTIGRGAYSKVKKCINLKTKEEFAVKIINKRLLRKKKKSYGKTKEGTLKINYMIDDALNEINIYKSFQGTNKNVIQLYQILNDNQKDKTYLIMELASKGPLVTLNEKTGIFCINSNYRDDIYNEELIKTWIYDIANGLKFLHENNIVHRDIKSDNILIDKNGHCKIADFGCSIKLKNGQPDLFTKTEGNMYFFPPEFVDGKSKKQFGYKPVDIWAFGVSMYTCIFKTLPFLPENRENVVELFKEIREAKFDYNKNGIKISKEMETLLSHILEKDPQKRFTAKDIVEYPWLNSK